MSRNLGTIATLLSCSLMACGESASPATPGSPAGSSAGGASSMAGTSSGGAGGAPGGSAGSATSGGAGAPSGGSGGAPNGGAGGAASGGNAGSGGTGGAAGGAGGCAPPAIICDDFEKYAAGATDLSPDWIAYTYSGTLHVDATKPHAGQQSLHLTVQQGMRHYADIIRETRGQQLLPQRHFGRLMLWLTQVPSGAQHWNINFSSGPLTGFPDEIAKFAEGGMFGKLMSNYAQRGRAKAGDQYLLRGGGPEQGDAGADADCAVAAPNQTIEAGKWVCWEWEFDGTQNAAHLWLDGQAMTEVDAVGAGKQCQGPGFNGKPMSASYGWESPQVFDKLIVGWEQYQDMPAQEVWIDDLVVGTERIGCPAP